MPLVKFISPTDPKWLSTLDALTASLVSDSLVYRYNPRPSPDGVHGAEGTFSACSFWYVEALPAPDASTRRGCRSRRCSSTPTT
jgi:GH15 family glucan-1,4-alpha-glucosidase